MSLHDPRISDGEIERIRAEQERDAGIGLIGAVVMLFLGFILEILRAR